MGVKMLCKMMRVGLKVWLRPIFIAYVKCLIKIIIWAETLRKNH